MKLFRKLSILAAVAILAVTAFAQGDAKAVLKEINDFRTAKLTEARSGGRALTQEVFNTITDAVKAKAEVAVKDVDVTKIEAKDAYDWAVVFSMAGKHKEVCDLSHKFLMSGPTPEQSYAARILMMQSCNALGEADMLVDTMASLKPSSPIHSNQMYSAALNYSSTIAKKKGVDAAIKVLDDVSGKLVFEDPQVVADRNFDAEKKRNEAANKTLTPEEEAKRKEFWLTNAKSSQAATRFGIIERKAELLVDAKRKDDAVRELDKFIGEQPEGSPTRRSASMFKTRLTLPNSPAPALNFERGYGGVNSLASLKGKVVIVDMFAHWCGPCIASFPEMRKMYDELKDKGLEIVGVTTYYGYYKAERPLDKDAEYARMADFMAEHKMNWPVVYGDRTNFENYGVSGIPTVFILDKTGKVVDMHVGYSPQSFKEFRAKVEELLGK